MLPALSNLFPSATETLECLILSRSYFCEFILQKGKFFRRKTLSPFELIKLISNVAQIHVDGAKCFFHNCLSLRSLAVCESVFIVFISIAGRQVKLFKGGGLKCEHTHEIRLADNRSVNFIS